MLSDGDKSSCDSDSTKKNTSCDQTAPIMCITVTDTESEDEIVNDDIQHTAGHTGISGAENWPLANGNELSFKKFPLKCGRKNCPNYFENEGAMMYHLSVYHSKGIIRSLECFLCRKSLASARSLKEHMNAFHTHTQKIKCTDCPRIFYHNSALINHIKQSHYGKSVSSDEKNQLASSDVMNDRNHDEFSVRCDLQYCKNIFQTDGAKMYHMSTYHRCGIKRTYECFLCKSPNANLRWLKNHMNGSHSLQKRFKCPFPDCRLIFDQKPSVLKHIYWHHVRKVVSYGKRYRSVNHRAVNEKNNSNFKFKCDLRNCTNLLESTDAMMYHLSTYHRRGKKRPFECFLCKVRSLELQSLKQHMNAMHCNRISYKCSFPDCLLTFYSSSMIRKHIKAIHVNWRTLELRQWTK